MAVRCHFLCAVAAILVVSALSSLGGETPFAASAADSEEPAFAAIHDLYDLLLQRAALEERVGDGNDIVHQVVRKSNRSPSLRLRFGRRADGPLDGAEGGRPHPSPASDSKGAWPDQRMAALYP